MGNIVRTVIRDHLLQEIDGKTCDELIEFFTDLKEDHGGDIVLDYYFDRDNDDRIQIAMIASREATSEEIIEQKTKQLKDLIQFKTSQRNEVTNTMKQGDLELERLNKEITEAENRLKEIQSEHSQT